MEIWKDIDGLEGRYQISNLGRVKSLNYKRSGKEGIMFQGTDRGGYKYVILCGKTMRVHRLVAIAFIPNPYNLPQVNHKDEDTANNTADNLEWCDQRYNNCWGTGIERRVAKRSKPVYQYTVSGELVKEWTSTHTCERELGIPLGMISKSCLKARPYNNFRWSYEKV